MKSQVCLLYKNCDAFWQGYYLTIRFSLSSNNHPQENVALRRLFSISHEDVLASHLMHGSNIPALNVGSSWFSLPLWLLQHDYASRNIGNRD